MCISAVRLILSTLRASFSVIVSASIIAYPSNSSV
jgi:hypothetical protein